MRGACLEAIRSRIKTLTASMPAAKCAASLSCGLFADPFKLFTLPSDISTFAAEWSYSLYEIKEKYIVVTEPKHRTMKTYKFGYDTDNPSFEFLRHRIFNEPNAGTISETFYTLNLEDAKKFFLENITNYINEHGNRALESVYEKLTERFLFNLYELTDNFDVFVAFETMNNRGRQLSDLELLKNRLIYLTTLYAPEEVSDDMKQNTRKKINDAWKEIYHQLGRNKTSPLNDDEFLRAHWIMYFKYSRVKYQNSELKYKIHF